MPGLQSYSDDACRWSISNASHSSGAVLLWNEALGEDTSVTGCGKRGCGRERKEKIEASRECSHGVPWCPVIGRHIPGKGVQIAEPDYIVWRHTRPIY